MGPPFLIRSLIRIPEAPAGSSDRARAASATAEHLELMSGHVKAVAVAERFLQAARHAVMKRDGATALRAHEMVVSTGRREDVGRPVLSPARRMEQPDAKEQLKRPEDRRTTDRGMVGVHACKELLRRLMPARTGQGFHHGDSRRRDPIAMRSQLPDRVISESAHLFSVIGHAPWYSAFSVPHQRR
jgi:hypothetical protein